MPKTGDFTSEKCEESHLTIEKTPKDSISKLNELVSQNINIRAAFIHIIGDFLQSLGVLLASVIIYVRPEFKIADPLCTIIFSAIVFATTLPIVSDIINVLSEACPNKLDPSELATLLKTISGVKFVNDIKVWSLSTDSCCIAVQILVHANQFQLDTVFLNELTLECKRVLMRKHCFKHIFIQLELDDTDCSVYSNPLMLDNFKQSAFKR